MTSTDTLKTDMSLLESAEKTWHLWGPNSDGGEAWFFARGQLWHRRYGDHDDVSEPVGPQEFIDRYWPQKVGRGRRHGRIIRWLVAQGYGYQPVEEVD